MRIIKPSKIVPNPNQYPLISPDSNWEVPAELPDLSNVGEIALDTETNDRGIKHGYGPGWATGQGYVAGVGVAWRTGASIQRIYVPITHPDTVNFPKDNVARWVGDITKTNRVVMFNAGYDVGWLHADMGVPVPARIDDASCAAFLIDENREDLSLDGVCKWRGVPGKDTTALREAAVIFGFREKDAVAYIAQLPARYAGPYGEQDPASTLELMENLRVELAAQNLGLAYATEMRLIPIIHAMRKRGIRIDLDRAEALRKRMIERSDQALLQLSSKLGIHVGMDEVRSHKWLVETFQNEGVPHGDRDGKATFERDWMRRASHFLPRLIAEARQCRDMSDKFIGKFLLDFASVEHGNHNTARVHASINQWLYENGGTRSHRLSYTDPPLQQAPSRPEAFDGWPLTGETAIEYRNCFLPEEGELWFSPDYSQQEYRLIVADAEKLKLPRADVAGDMYRNDPKTDFHNVVVQLTGLPRHHAKDCNFAKSYGAGVPKFAAMTNKTVEEAEEIMTTYDRELPFVKALGARCDQRAQSRGYIRLFDGARCHFDNYEAGYLSGEERSRGYAEQYRMAPCSREEAMERQQIEGHPWQGTRLKRSFTHKAMNRRIQGNAARQMKLAMVACGEAGHLPLIQMHDEMGFSLSDPKAGAWIAETMATVYKCSVPFLVDADWGKTWGDAKHSFEDTHLHDDRSGIRMGQQKRNRSRSGRKAQ